MNDRSSSPQVIASADLREFFQHSIDDALSRQGVNAAVETSYYLVNLLTAFLRAERLYDFNGERLEIRPLALLYADALAERTPEQRNRVMRRLGDIALFISGVFAESLNRKLVDVDYYIAMGSTAYGYLSEAMRGTRRGDAFCEIFEELSSKFPEFVDVLAQVNERGSPGRPADVLRLYELWLRTGSRCALERLRELGIEPSGATGSVPTRFEQ